MPIEKSEQQTLALWQLIGFAAVSLFGTLLHFVYDWTKSPVAALFSGVNESTWEHMKLLFFPMLLVAVVQSIFLFGAHADVWCIKLRGTLAGLALIPALFYTLRGVFGVTPDWVNITIFFVAAALASLYELHLFIHGKRPCNTAFAIGVFVLIALLFWVFTFYPPHLPLFRDPISGRFGIAA